MRPLGLNAFKSVRSLLLPAATLPVAGVAHFPAAPPGHFVLRLASGLVGIAVADTLFVSRSPSWGGPLGHRQLPVLPLVHAPSPSVLGAFVPQRA